MRTEAEREIVFKLKMEGKSFNEISRIMNLTRNVIINMYYYDRQFVKKKCGPKFKLNSYQKLRIKRQVAQYKLAQEKINATKMKKACYLDVSTRSIQRHFKDLGYKYARAKSQIILSKKHKEARLDIITDWLTNNHPWHCTVFSDEKRFSLDGPDDWRTYRSKSENIIRCKRQCKGGSVIVWMMVLPNYLLSFSVLECNFQSSNYVKHLKERVLPIIMLNFGNNYFFQQDNASVHRSKEVQRFFEESRIPSISWPSKSPDINITEDVWKMISDVVYDGPSFTCKQDLVSAITNAINGINRAERHKIQSLYASFRSRLCKILRTFGNLCNK